MAARPGHRAGSAGLPGCWGCPCPCGPARPGPNTMSPRRPFPAATRNLHLNNATSGATFTRTVQPSPGQDNHHRKCLVQLKIARDVPRLLEFAILVWTIPAPVVQIHIAIPATDASGRVERLHHSANSLKRGPPAFILNLNFPACPCGQLPAV
jgi:hypothetical protein